MLRRQAREHDGSTIASPGQRLGRPALERLAFRRSDKAGCTLRERSFRDALETAFLAGVALVRSNPGFDPRGDASDIPHIIDLTDLPLDAQDGFALMSEVIGLGHPGSHPNQEPEPLVLRPFYTSDAKRSWWAELPEPASHARGGRRGSS
jgi:hypothetical protein